MDEEKSEGLARSFHDFHMTASNQNSPIEKFIEHKITLINQTPPFPVTKLYLTQSTILSNTSSTIKH